MRIFKSNNTNIYTDNLNIVPAEIVSFRNI